MKVIETGFECITEVNFIKRIKWIARVCYKLEDNIIEESVITMVKMLLKRSHSTIFEHYVLVFEVLKMSAFHLVILFQL